jgi:hypothetical protein
MTQSLERLLDTRCLDNPDVVTLRAQWDFDKRLLSSALQSVSRIFPHYSRHDASHSHSILVQIERFLGPDSLALLSATDIWLLLEAAYHHDTGMIVTNKQLDELWKSPRFSEYLQSLRTSPDKDFSEAATRLLDHPVDSSDATERPATITAEWPLHVVRAIRVVVSEFRRQDHAARSADVVSSPASIGLLSPRTGLIPDRLFTVLAKICVAHGRDFEEVMELPDRESGISSDTAHPRFIACLLRLGDLLDLDNGRFCPVMLACAGPLPKSSQAHVVKHAAIVRLRVDTEVIDVEANCSDDDVLTGGYDASTAWLDMLRRELQNQQSRWSYIVPDPRFRPLPSVGTIRVNISTLTSLGRVELDVRRAMDLLRGANIYGTPAVYVRELLQNAVDATLIRLWSQHRDQLHGSAAEQILVARDVLNTFPVSIAFRRSTDKTSADTRRWRLSVSDSGAGISKADVAHLRQVGSSVSNSEKQRLQSQMPPWLRPSGIFGIGLQSLFLVTEQIDIDTRSIATGEHLHIRMLRGENLRPTILARTVPDAGGTFGTTVSCEIELDPMPRTVTWSMRHKRVNKVMGNFDSLVDKEIPIAQAEVAEQTADYAEGSWVPIKYNDESLVTSKEGSSADWYFDPSVGIRVNVVPFDGVLGGRLFLRFRGAPVKEESHSHWPFCNVIADILEGSAADILTLSRESLRSDTAAHTLARINKGIEYAIVSRLDETKEAGANDSRVREQLSFALLSRSERAVSSKHSDWKSLKIGATGVAWGDLANATTIRLLSFGDAGFANQTTEIVKSEGGFEISDSSLHMGDIIEQIMINVGFEIVKLEQRQQQRLRINDTLKPRIEVLGKIPIVGAAIEEGMFREIVEEGMTTIWMGGRFSLPCLPDFAMLALQDGAHLPWLREVEGNIRPRMLFPFVVRHGGSLKADGLGELIAFVCKNSRQKVARKEIVRVYVEFIRYLEAVMATSTVWNERRTFDTVSVISTLQDMETED